MNAFLQWIEGEPEGSTSPSMNTVPNKPKTPIRGVRVPDEEWRPAQAKAKKCGETMTDVIRRAIRDYNKAGS